MNSFNELAKERGQVQCKSVSSEDDLDDVRPMLHTSHISKYHARNIAKLQLANDLIRVFISAVARNDSYNMSARIHSLFRSVASHRGLGESSKCLWKDEIENLILREIHRLFRN